MSRCSAIIFRPYRAIYVLAAVFFIHLMMYLLPGRNEASSLKCSLNPQINDRIVSDDSGNTAFFMIFEFEFNINL